MLKDDDKKENIKGVQAVEKNTEKKKYSRLGHDLWLRSSTSVLVSIHLGLVLLPVKVVARIEGVLISSF